MAHGMHTCVLLFVGTICVCARAALVSVKGFYCQDPDTGKLHAANTTWQSTTFCGNYTCKIRKKNSTEMEYLPAVKVINITNIDVFDKDDKIKKDFFKENENVISIDTKTESHMQPILHRENAESVNDFKNIFDKSNDNDRYLTESEIKTISDLLHTIKKSDLDAIVEIYNLAQDIYKEMDKETTENIIEETRSTTKSEKTDKVSNNFENSHVSYWYEPLHYNNYRNGFSKDLHVEGSNQVPTTIPPVENTPPSYFSGSLTQRDFGKIPYYYPMSNFQRMSSYIHNTPVYNAPPNLPKTLKQPCDKIPTGLISISPWFNRVMKTYEPQKTIQPSILLPYPFSYVQHYNFSAYPNNFYYIGNTWSNPNLYNRNNPKPYLRAAYVAQSPSTNLFADSELTNEIQDIEQNPVEKIDSGLLENLLKTAQSTEEIEKLPRWKTNSLPSSVIDEVRANVAEKSRLLKTFPLRKKIKLEKVGKVVSLDKLMRRKRDIDHSFSEEAQMKTNHDEYEVYIERTGCEYEKDMELGYYRRGNDTQPYPACCPQKINNR